MRGRALVVAAALLPAAGCGGSQTPARPTEPARISIRGLRAATHSAELAGRPPQAVLRACASARSKATMRVRCPTLAPGGRTTGAVLLPRRARPGGPGAVGDAGLLRYRAPRSIYVLTFLSAGLDDGHWMLAGGRTAQVTNQFLRVAPGTRLSRPRRIQRAGRALRVVRYPPYPAGGINGGHIVVSLTQGAMTYVASVHGYGHEDVAIAVVLSMR